MSDALALSYRKAQRHLARRDPVLRHLIKQVGSCTLVPKGTGFTVLAGAIISQQISTKAAIAIRTKLETALVPEGLTPSAVLGATPETLRGAGLSRAKTAAILDLATRVHTGQLPLDALPAMRDEEVVELLVEVRGIGVWTAEMYLIFSLGRLDVLPVDDLGLRAGVQTQYELPEMPTRAALRERGESWRPYRSIATWYFWRSRGVVPYSKETTP